mmetsp:Transcript_13889/g.38295  ORF Transcript_13889/g.38295 Transcript_13889/m.38295 type:complete len:232 (+) Transcript_13889:202-897(+)
MQLPQAVDYLQGHRPHESLNLLAMHRQVRLAAPVEEVTLAGELRDDISGLIASEDAQQSAGVLVAGIREEGGATNVDPRLLLAAVVPLVKILRPLADPGVRYLLDCNILACERINHLQHKTVAGASVRDLANPPEVLRLPGLHVAGVESGLEGRLPGLPRGCVPNLCRMLPLGPQQRSGLGPGCCPGCCPRDVRCPWDADALRWDAVLRFHSVHWLSGGAAIRRRAALAAE